MSTETRRRNTGSVARQASQGGALTGAEVKTRLREQHGMTLKQWAEKNQFPYETVSNVVRGINRGTYGMGYRIAAALGMKRGG